MSEDPSKTQEVINPATGLPFDFSKFSSDAMLRGGNKSVKVKVNKNGARPKCKQGFCKLSPGQNNRTTRDNDREWQELFDAGKASKRDTNGRYWTS